MFHSIGIIHSNIETKNNYIENIINEQKVHRADILILNDAIGIKETRKINSFLSLKPFASNLKLVIIDGGALTPEAQQSLLKILEEPPLKSLFIITVTSINLLLPTILSRCQIIDLNTANPKTPATQTERKQNFEFWQFLLTKQIGERMKSTDNLVSDRESAKRWIENQITFFREELFDFYGSNQKNFLYNHAVHYVKTLKVLLMTHKFVVQNINLKLTFDHLFLNLPT